MIQAFFALVSVVAYTIYAGQYEQVIRKSNSVTSSSVILYLIAGLMILGLTALTYPFCSEAWSSFALPQHLTLWGNLIGMTSVGANVLFSMSVMAVFYAIHIWTEAKARFSMNVGLYSILFQINVIVIVAIKAIFEGHSFGIESYIGICVILLGGILPFLKDNPKKMTWEVVYIAVISAFTAAIALFTDGELVRQVIFKENFEYEHISLFLFYEALTFLIPCSIIAITLLIKEKKGFIFSFTQEIKDSGQRRLYFNSAFASALQFIFAVFALAIDPKSLLPIGILSITPIFGVLSENIIKKNKKIKNTEIIAALLVALGLILLRK